MQHIDKTNNVAHTAFKRVVDPYLIGGHFRYEDLEDVDRVKMRGIFFKEQDGKCAYCMRDVSSPLPTIDHIIPKDVAQQEYGMARKHYGKGLYRNDFIWDKQYTPESFNFMYYPHSLAYGNMVLACENCNSKKDRELIVPTFFKNSIPITYNTNGRVSIPNAEHFPEELTTYLNADTFMRIRCLWNAVKQSGLQVHDVETADDEGKRLAVLNAIQGNITWNGYRTRLMAAPDEFVTDAHWEVFISFRWFWHYY